MGHFTYVSETLYLCVRLLRKIEKKKPLDPQDPVLERQLRIPYTPGICNEEVLTKSGQSKILAHTNCGKENCLVDYYDTLAGSFPCLWEGWRVLVIKTD